MIRRATLKTSVNAAPRNSRFIAQRPIRARGHYRKGYLTDGRVLFWEYPRETPQAEQTDLVEVMEIEDGLIPLPQNEMEKRKYAVAKAKNDLEFQQNAYELKKQMGGDNWASSDEAKKQMQKIHEAEKQLDKAKEAYKPFEQFEEKPAKAASNP